MNKSRTKLSEIIHEWKFHTENFTGFHKPRSGEKEQSSSLKNDGIVFY